MRPLPPGRRPAPARATAATALALALALGTCGCARLYELRRPRPGSSSGSSSASAATRAPAAAAAFPTAPPLRRSEGPRDLGFAGGDPATKGWARVDDLLWVRREDEAAFRRGLLRCGDAHLPFDEADRIEKTPDDGYVLRTDHVVLRTNVTFCRAASLARVVERHVRLVLEALGPALDLRFPAEPLRVVVAARRAEFRAGLEARHGGRHGAAHAWSAYYDGGSGTVHVCDEPDPAGGLSVVADLRHETTHAVLDLGRPERGRARMFDRPHFWAWEGVAMWTEGLGDPEGGREGALRASRFRRRVAWGDLTPLAELFALGQDAFLGRHYDQTAVLFAWLMDVDGGALRPGLLALVARVMDGEAERDDVVRLLGRPVEDLEASFRTHLSA